MVLSNRSRRARPALAALLTSLVAASATANEEGDHGSSRLGGHIGVAVPLVSFVDDETVTPDELLVVALPMGVTVKRALGRLAFDMEIVPAFTEHNDVNVTIHPGLILGGRHGAVGMRAAFESESDAIGFTPLVARPFRIGESLFFFELDVPVRFPKGDVDSVIGVATHLGIAF